MKRPQTAVLLAVFNGMQYLEEQVSSILAQRDTDITIFVSVDQSSDGSESWFEARALQEPRIVLLPQGLRFGSAGKNFFRLIRDVDFSFFDFIAFADQDDCWFEDKIANAIAALKANSTDAYSSNVLAFWPEPDTRRLLINKAQAQKKWDYLFEAAGPGCTYVFTAPLMHAIKQQLIKDWEAHLGVALHDWYCYAFARAQGYRWTIDHKPSLLYRQHAHNEIGVNRGIRAALARLKKIKNGWWLNQSLLIASLVGLQGQDHAFIKSWQARRRWDMLRLSKHAFQCRRKFKEQCLFFFICLSLSFSGTSREP